MRFRSFDSLNIFRTVAERMSFTAAAEALNMSKGAVSYQIAKLEEELGLRLFERREGETRWRPLAEDASGRGRLALLSWQLPELLMLSVIEGESASPNLPAGTSAAGASALSDGSGDEVGDHLRFASAGRSYK